ncbi:MAG: AzlD domain-containing protein [Succinivibrio dextrinosolvens]|nr:AzlD domain-containing protein [Succinivibrio dextrinosolvens]MDY6466343.1 AzlD domain-containing protein [Succinivibrio dextrinosolvens]MDY6469539.1 AzlD domain-containing protein [Succinivibrio dextrinosolvens]
MDSNYYLYIILISFLVTYPIRAIPALFISKLSLSSYWQRVLDLVPYTALTALVFPGIFYCVENSQYAGYIGAIFAIIAALCKMSLSVVVLIAVISVYLSIII